ncbi:MAG: amylo-alpha-1,6-glucosidase [Candidatus Thermoplasmatota archaeon]|nr:amylo-alpha-1,6-glucosidase [Candidatus Thermoplasmatota archaeon]
MREWLVTNGLGGYASLTSKNTNTSKFHGLLITSLNPPTERWVFVSNIIDKIQINNETHLLENYKKSYSFDYFPNFTYESDDIKIKKTILMQHGKNTTIIKYDIKNKKPLTMIHGPIIHSRHFYYLNIHRYLSFQQNIEDSTLFIKPENIDKTLKIVLKDCAYTQKNYWETMYYEKDRKRRDSWIDNAVHTGYFYKLIKKPTVYYLVLTIVDDININPSDVFSEEKQRKEKIIKESNLSEKFEKLVLSSDNFIVKKGNGKSVIAGYPWFADWGRDTLIALPGLTLVPHRFDDAKQILSTFASFCKNGLIPNVFDDRDSKPSYNTVDASLWFIDRVYQYMKYTNDIDFLKDIWETMESIIQGYKNGTDYNIFMDKDYLISHDPGLTWMDVKIGDYHPTPRCRKAVEIQALWYNALMIMNNLTEVLDKKNSYIDLADKVKQSFNNQFDRLYDVLDTKDASIRPNIVFLSALDFSMINKNIQEKIVDTYQEKLLTVFGPRTLSKDDSRYKGYLFGHYNKDEAYHNGIVWPWLMGSFIKSYVKLNSDEKSRDYAYKKFIKPMFDVFGDNWDGSIYEIFDAEPVYAPQGCISQAWSVAEILRACVEDIENKKPDFENKFVLNKISI